MLQNIRITFALAAFLAANLYAQEEGLETQRDGFFVIDALGCYVPLPSIMVLKHDPDAVSEVFFYSDVDRRDPNYDSLDGRVSILQWAEESDEPSNIDGLEYESTILEESGSYSLNMARTRLRERKVVSFHMDDKVSRVFFSGGLFNEDLVRKIFQYCLAHPNYGITRSGSPSGTKMLGVIS